MSINKILELSDKYKNLFHNFYDLPINSKKITNKKLQIFLIYWKKSIPIEILFINR